MFIYKTNKPADQLTIRTIRHYVYKISIREKSNAQDISLKLMKKKGHNLIKLQKMGRRVI